MVIAGGISFYGVGKLVFLDGTMNDFAYGQTLMFYKDDIDSIREKYNKILIIEQDGATCHKSKRNTKLLNSLFGEAKSSKFTGSCLSDRRSMGNS